MIAFHLEIGFRDYNRLVRKNVNNFAVICRLILSDVYNGWKQREELRSHIVFNLYIIKKIFYLKYVNNLTRWDNQEWKTHWHWQHWVHKTLDEGKQTKNTTQKTKKRSNTDPNKNRGWTQVLEKGTQFLLFKRYPSCYSYRQYDEEKQSRNTTQYVLYTHMHKQTQVT